ncbi:MAG: hypothetical protein O3C63_08410 [Cyanobacteria bacterium]|nr:hypothetical protein [Cyanobacteriota bacterium]MDA1020314.1 hypothetical protein [Cyanobacteriota bacterium]
MFYQAIQELTKLVKFEGLNPNDREDLDRCSKANIRPVSKRSFDVQVALKKVATALNARVAFGDNSDFQNKSNE